MLTSATISFVAVVVAIKTTIFFSVKEKWKSRCGNPTLYKKKKEQNRRSVIRGPRPPKPQDGYGFGLEFIPPLYSTQKHRQAKCRSKNELATNLKDDWRETFVLSSKLQWDQKWRRERRNVKKKQEEEKRKQEKTKDKVGARRHKLLFLDFKESG